MKKRKLENYCQKLTTFTVAFQLHILKCCVFHYMLLMLLHLSPGGSASPHTHVAALTKEGVDISDHGQSDPLITPVKSRFPHVRKTVSPGGPVIQKRKFPGPAGILPQPVSTYR